jgi:hypothetical protein
MPRKTTKADADAKPKRRVSAKATPKPKPPVSRVSRVRATGRGGRGR